MGSMSRKGSGTVVLCCYDCTRAGGKGSVAGKYNLPHCLYFDAFPNKLQTPLDSSAKNVCNCPPPSLTVGIVHLSHFNHFDLCVVVSPCGINLHF